MEFLNSAVKELKLKNTFTAEELQPPKFYVDMGAMVFNAALSGSIYGGMQSNSILALCGETSTGKTFFALEAILGFQRQFPNGEVVYFESEKAIKKDMLKNRGIDENRVMISEVVTIQEFRTRAIQILDAYAKIEEDKRPPMMFVLDSLGNLSTTKEMEDTAEGKETKDMTKAGLIKATFRVLAIKSGQLNVPIIVTNHVYEMIGQMFPTKEIAGGSGIKYIASSICMLGKRKEKEGTDVIGNTIGITMKKSRDTVENTRVRVLLDYEKGLSRYHGMLDLAEESGIFKKNGVRFEVVNSETGEIVKIYGKSILKDPKKYFTKDVLDKIEEFVQVDFKYGRGKEADSEKTIDSE